MNKGIDYTQTNIYDAIGRPDLKPENRKIEDEEDEEEFDHEREHRDREVEAIRNQ